MTRTLTGRWNVVTSQSTAGFAVRDFGLLTVRGRLPISSARVDVDESGAPTAVYAELDLAGIDTGNGRRDRDLRKAKLLGTDEFPTLTFTGRRGESDGTSWQVPGQLVGRGTAVDVVLAVTMTGDDRVRATTSFDRRDLGIRAPRFLIGYRVDVTVDAALRPAS
jgi:polyisoprenoid-binding protein YceI